MAPPNPMAPPAPMAPAAPPTVYGSSSTVYGSPPAADLAGHGVSMGGGLVGPGPVVSGVPMSAAPSPAAPAGYTPPVPAARAQLPARRSGKKPRRDDCAELRAECVRLREQADATIQAAAQASAEADEAHTRYVQAQRATEEATRGARGRGGPGATIQAQLLNLERESTGVRQRISEETTHAAFAAYRRGDLSSDQLREVFRRAEGWTPEQDQLSHDALALRTEETEAMRLREAADAAEQTAAEHARITAISARALDDEAHAAVVDARGVCAAAADCTARQRR